LRKRAALLASAAAAVVLVSASLVYILGPRVATIAPTSGSANNLQLTLQVAARGNGTYKVEVQEINLLTEPNKVSVGNQWPYPPVYLDPFDGCGAYSSRPIGFAVLQGNYDLADFTQGKALPLFNTTYASTCTTTLYPVAYYRFNPSSDVANLTDSRGMSLGNETVSISLLVAGYWTGGQGNWGGSSSPVAFHTFRGMYTVVAADEWGGVALSHFAVLY